jgi:site-specific recombinase XerC
MKIYKHPYIDRRSGKKKECRCWYIGFTDTKMTRRQLPAFPSRKSTERAAQKIEELLSCCGVLNRDLQKWIEEIPESMRKRLVTYGMIDNRRVSENIGKPLLMHLEDFCAGLAADGRTADYVHQNRKIIGDILDGCRFSMWSDIDGNRVKTFLAKNRGPDGYGERTYNAYLRAFKEFCGWLIQEDRVAGSDPMKGHSLIKQTEFRKKRRALTFEEMSRLLNTTEDAPSRFNMTGHERNLVYKLALQAGLRAGEIKSLRALSFDFDAKPPTVHVEPSDTKGKKPADLVLMPETAMAIQEFLTGKEPTDKAFAMPHKANAACMIRADLIDAGIEYRDDADRDMDFHALRHSFITHLALALVHPTVAQKLARHASIETTMRYYTHVLHKSEVEAIDSLRCLTSAYTNQATQATILDVHGRKKGDYDSEKRLSA